MFWTEMNVYGSFIVDFAEQGNLHLFGAGILFRESKGKKHKGQHIYGADWQNYLPETSAKLWSTGERCENEPQLSLPAQWFPWAVNLGGTIYLHYLCTQVVKPPDWILMRAGTLLCVLYTEHNHSDALPPFASWRVMGILCRIEWDFQANRTAS